MCDGPQPVRARARVCVRVFSSVRARACVVFKSEHIVSYSDRKTLSEVMMDCDARSPVSRQDVINVGEKKTTAQQTFRRLIDV